MTLYIPRSFGGTLLILSGSTALATHPVGSLATYYRGKSVIPVLPSGLYMVNGTVLDSQPIICTSSLESNGSTFLPGSTFFLLFDRPSMLTQSLLPDGSLVFLTFAIPGGSMITGQVKIASTLMSIAGTATFAVTCTLVLPTMLLLP